VRWWVSAVVESEFHASIVLECVFDDKLFSNKIRENHVENCTQPLNLSPPRLSLTIPPPAFGDCSFASPGAGVKAGRRPPAGLGLDTGKDGATLEKPGAKIKDISMKCHSTGSRHDHTQVASTMIDNNTATTTVFISNPSTLCTLTIRRIELVTTVVSVVPNVAEQPIAR
jgi:hypothetical protein